jgi:hypothetical protein
MSSEEFTPAISSVRHDYAILVDWRYEERLAEFDRWLAEHDAEVRKAALVHAAAFVDSQRYIDEPADLRQVRDRLYGIADDTYNPEED